MKGLNTRESGAALALILIMVFVLSVGMAAVSMTTRSASGAVKTNALESERRSAIVNDALAKAVQDLNNKNGSSARYGLDVGGSRCEDGFLAGRMGPYTSAEFSSEPVTVYCKEMPRSGEVAALSSLILTGTTVCPTSGCQVGLDGGLNAKVSGGKCDASTPHMSFGAGILNSSGAWSGSGCTTLSFPADIKLIQPATTDPTCPANKYSNGNAPLTCSCPNDGGSAWLLTGTLTTYSTSECVTDVENIAANQVDSTQSGSTLKAFIDSRMAEVESPSGAVVVTKIAGTACKYTITGGTVTQSLWTSLKAAIGNSACILEMTSGVYRFDNVLFDPPSSTTVIAGAPDNSGNQCNPLQPGVQLQFSGTSRLVVASAGLVSVCALRAGSPSIIAPATGSWISNPTTYVIETKGGSASSTKQALIVNGYVLAPGSPASLTINGSFMVTFNDGAMFRALTVTSTASPRLDSNVKPPPAFTGDRVVQLRFRGNQNRDLGTVQVVIRDFFGRRPASGLSILTWRTLW